ncbi:MAG: alkaline phosphatase family protein [Acidobacteriota bacterium]|nr:alkaline phosphatase family protein [Acidobacteriota bacterium]
MSIRAGCLVVAAWVAMGCGGGGPVVNRHLLIVLDGLRPDYVQPHLMPALYELGQRGVQPSRHHAVFPTVTRVNAASISTGAYPETHGLLGNEVFFPDVEAGRFLTTSDRANLLRIETETDDTLLSTGTLAEVLQRNGHRLLVVSAGSSGSSYLLNHTVADGAIVHYDYSLPPALHDRAVETLGAVPEAGTPNHERNRWIVDAFLDVALTEVDPTVTLLWLSDPDTTAHAHGIGHPTMVEALFRLDAEIQRVQDGLAAAGRLESTNIWVTSDHGFSEHTGAAELTTILERFAGELEGGMPRVVAGAGAVYVRDEDAATVARIVSALQASERVGAVFTRAAHDGADEGVVPGTLAFGVANWDHARSAQILFSPRWTDVVGEYGFPGTAAQVGVAGHGSASPFDIHNTLVATGPDLKNGVSSNVPSGNVDFAPTFLYTLGLDIPSAMQGRVLHELLTTGPDPSQVVTDTTEVRVETDDGGYVVTAQRSHVDGRTYLDEAAVERE